MVQNTLIITQQSIYHCRSGVGKKVKHCRCQVLCLTAENSQHLTKQHVNFNSKKALYNFRIISLNINKYYDTIEGETLNVRLQINKILCYTFTTNDLIVPATTVATLQKNNTYHTIYYPNGTNILTLVKN